MFPWETFALFPILIPVSFYKVAARHPGVHTGPHWKYSAKKAQRGNAWFLYSGQDTTYMHKLSTIILNEGTC